MLFAIRWKNQLLALAFGQNELEIICILDIGKITILCIPTVICHSHFTL